MIMRSHMPDLLLLAREMAVRRGKLLNVRDATAAQIGSNAEIQNIKQIMGLQHGKVPSYSATPACCIHLR